VALPSSGEISIGMLNFEIMSGDDSVTQTSETATSNDSSNNDMAALANNYSANADSAGSTTRANLLNGPYGMDEFYGYTYNACVLVGTEIFMADGSVRFVEDLIIGDEVLSIVMPNMTKTNYKKYSVEDLIGFEKKTTTIKSMVFDFKSRYIEINKKLKATESHAAFAKKGKKFEWWRMKDLEIGDELVTPDLELEEIKIIEHMVADAEVVALGLSDTQTYFANGYLCHR
tara:strand:+ start:39 stop:728 length:690 start_codon:yes stop_codon:yes gene_type:complete